ncbi:MAG: discoidin domain-containing protein, partial [Actinobacteria bacterium]|nr:discoidin domain-containing protein [Actinomycetota bacterium]
MLQRSFQQIPLGVFLALLLTVPVYAGKNYKISNYGSGHQIWFEAEAYDEREPDTDAGFALSDEPGAFGRSITNRSGSDGAYLLRYDFDIRAAGGRGGTWYFWGRVINPDNRSSFMLVDGHPGDPTPVTTLPVTGLVNGQRIFEQSLGNTWTWARTNHGEAHTKTLRDGLNTMYILSREDRGIMDVFMWTDDPDYRPTDDDYRNAKVPVIGAASSPSPNDGATDVPRDVTLTWAVGKFAVAHDVYLGTGFADVNSAARTDAKGVLASQGQADATFAPAGVLAYGQTYYWRADEVNKPSDNQIFKGNVWSFTVEPYGYPIAPVAATASSSQPDMGPERTIDGSGMAGDLHGVDGTTMWLSDAAGPQPNWIQYEFDRAYKLHDLQVWNSNGEVESFIGFGAKGVTVETSIDGTTWTPVANVPEFSQAPGTPGYAANTTVNLGDVEAKFVKLTIGTSWGGISPVTGLSEVRFSYAPMQARAPLPGAAAKEVSVNTSLQWRPGRGAASHNVYFGTDADAVTNGTAAAKTMADHGFTPDSLLFGTTYYWRVDEVNAVTYPGDVWSFTTQEYAAVDDFESYTDKEGEQIFSAWVDGFTNGTNGSTVGYMTAARGTFGETTIIHGGKQSMPLDYNNT